MMDAAEALVIARMETRTRREQIQGFLYGKRHVVRDCLRHPDEQELFSIDQSGDDYETAHAEMMLALEMEKAKVIIQYLGGMGFQVAPSPQQQEMK